MEVIMKMNKKLIGLLLMLAGGSLFAMEHATKRIPISQVAIFKEAQKADFDLAKNFFAITPESTILPEFLKAVLMGNFSLSWVQKCDLINTVRQRLDTTGDMHEWLNKLERYMLLGKPLHGLNDEELKELE